MFRYSHSLSQSLLQSGAKAKDPLAPEGYPSVLKTEIVMTKGIGFKGGLKPPGGGLKPPRGGG